jgi:hypothetical protein
MEYKTILEIVKVSTPVRDSIFSMSAKSSSIGKSSNPKVENLDAEDLEVFKRGLETLLKTSIDILGSMDEMYNRKLKEFENASLSKREEYEMITKRLQNVETMTERTRLYQNDFAATVNKDMDEHYNLFRTMYQSNKPGVISMAKSCRTKGKKDVSWITTNSKHINVIIDKDAQIVIHLGHIYGLGLELHNKVDRAISFKYQKLIDDGEDEDDAKDDMTDEKEHSHELSYANRLTLAILTIFMSITDVRFERRILKSAVSHLQNLIPEDSDGGGGLFDNLGDMLGGFFNNMGGDSSEGGGGGGGGAIDSIASGLKTALGGESESIKNAIDRASKSTNLAELGQNISSAFNDPDVTGAVKEQVTRFTQGSQVKPPPTADGTIPASAIEPINEVEVDVGDDVCLDISD